MNIVNQGTCSYCGEEMGLELLDSDQRCKDCAEKYVEEDEDDEHRICPYCNGSGEGAYDRIFCFACGGLGTL